MFQIVDKGSTFFTGYVDGDTSESYIVDVEGISQDVSSGQEVQFSGLAPQTTYVVNVSVTGPPLYTQIVIKREEYSNYALSLAEVQVFNQSGVNIALKGTAVQSSVSNEGYAPRAIDDNTNGTFSNGSVTHTEKDGTPWWKLDLKEPSEISHIIVWNRNDCCEDRLNGCVLLVYDTTGDSVRHVLNSNRQQTFKIS